MTDIPIVVGRSISRRIGRRSNEIAAIGIGGAAGNGLIAGCGFGRAEHRSRYIAHLVIGIGLLGGAVAAGEHTVHEGGIIGIGVGDLIAAAGAGAGGDGLHISVGVVGGGLSVQAGRHRLFGIAVGVVLHLLDRGGDHREIVKPGGICIALIDAGDRDLIHDDIGLLGGDGQAGILPIRNIRVEGNIIVFGVIVVGITAVGDLCPDAELLGIVVSRVAALGNIICHRVCLCPAGNYIALAAQPVEDDRLEGIALGVHGIARDLQAFAADAAIHIAGAVPLIPGVVAKLHIAVFQQVIVGGSLSGFQLDIVHIERACCAGALDEESSGSVLRCGKGDADPLPAPFVVAVGDMRNGIACVGVRPGNSLQVHTGRTALGNCQVGGTHIGREGIGLIRGKGQCGALGNGNICGSA